MAAQKSKPKSKGSAGQLATRPEMRGRGPKPGAANAGRPPIELVAECKRLQRGVILEKCEEAVASLPVGSPAFQWAATWISRYGHSDAARRVALTVEDVEGLDDATLEMLAGE